MQEKTILCCLTSKQCPLLVGKNYCQPILDYLALCIEMTYAVYIWFVEAFDLTMALLEILQF